MEFIPLSEQSSFGNLRTSDAWYRAIYLHHEIVILDPDGWDRKNYQFSFFEELISLNEFHRRVMSSTCIYNKSMSENIALGEKYVKEHNINPNGSDDTQVEKLAKQIGISEDKSTKILQLTKNEQKWKIWNGSQIGEIEP